MFDRPRVSNRNSGRPAPARSCRWELSQQAIQLPEEVFQVQRLGEHGRGPGGQSAVAVFDAGKIQQRNHRRRVERGGQVIELTELRAMSGAQRFPTTSLFTDIRNESRACSQRILQEIR